MIPGRWKVRRPRPFQVILTKEESNNNYIHNNRKRYTMTSIENSMLPSGSAIPCDIPPTDVGDPGAHAGSELPSLNQFHDGDGSMTTGAEAMPPTGSITTVNFPSPAHGGGPKTAEGRDASKCNSLAHGLYARQVVVEELGEDKAAFDELLDQLKTAYQPKGLLEEYTLARIGVAIWKEMRVDRYESAEIQQEVRKVESRLAELQRRVKPGRDMLDACERAFQAIKSFRGAQEIPWKDIVEGPKKLLKKVRDCCVTQGVDYPASDADGATLCEFAIAKLGWSHERVLDALDEIVQEYVTDWQKRVGPDEEELEAARSTHGTDLAIAGLRLEEGAAERIHRQCIALSRQRAKEIEMLMKMQAIRIALERKLFGQEGIN